LPEYGPEDFAPSVWDTWDAKSLRAKVDDGLAADAAVLARLQQVDDDRRARSWCRRHAHVDSQASLLAAQRAPAPTGTSRSRSTRTRSCSARVPLVVEISA